MLATASTALSACHLPPNPEPSDAGKYGLSFGLSDALYNHSHRVLVGSEFSAEVIALGGGGEVDPDGGGLACAHLSASGALTQPDPTEARFLVTAAEPGAIEIADPLISCPDNDDALAELGSDRWSMSGYEVDQVRSAWVNNYEALALRVASPGGIGAWPEDLGLPIERLLVAAGGGFSAIPVLLDPGGGERASVRWADADARLVVDERYAPLVPTLADDQDGEEKPGTTITGRLPAGERIPVDFELLGATFEMAPVESLPLEQIASLELVAGYETVPTTDRAREWGQPSGVLAIARDSEGRRILGAPVDWQLTRGKLHVSTLTAPSEFVMLADSCRRLPRRPQDRAATVEASVGDLVASIDLEWVALSTDPPPDPDDPNCHGTSCACSTPDADAPGQVLAAFALLALAVRRRQRRHASPRSAQAQAQA